MTQILGLVTCQTREFGGKDLIGILEIPRIAKISSNDNTISQSIIA